MYVVLHVQVTAVIDLAAELIERASIVTPSRFVSSDVETGYVYAN